MFDSVTITETTTGFLILLTENKNRKYFHYKSNNIIECLNNAEKEFYESASKG